MANLLSIISRDAFGDLARRLGPIEPGVTVPLDRYTSRHKSLDALGSDGTLWLVTVRPDPVRLWLVGVLRHPQARDDGWYAEPNTTPVIDITDQVSALRFSTGKGLPADPAKLAMALQTPRVLSEDDVVKLRVVVSPSAGSAYHAAMVETHGPRPARRRKALQSAGERSGGIRPWRAALVSIGVWQSLTENARTAAVAELCREISRPGRSFRVGSVRCGADLLATVVHEQSSSELVVIPGGVFAKGFTLDDFFALWRATGTSDDLYGEIHGSLASLRPPQLTAVRPFLLGRNLVDDASLCRAAGVDDPLAALEALGWRLPSSAEWEWMAREGGAVRFVGVPRDRHPLRPTLVPPAEEENGWGIQGLLNTENLVQGGLVRMGHTWWQWEAEARGLHAANEFPGGGTLRLAADLPDAPEPDASAFDWSTTLAETLSALTAGTGKDRQAAVWAVGELTAGCPPPAVDAPPAPDVVPTALAAVARLPSLDAKLLPKLLVSLGSLGAHGAADALRSDLPRVVEYLTSADDKVRTAAWFAWAHITDGSDLETQKRLLATEKKPQALASCLLALAHVAGGAVLSDLTQHRRHRQVLVAGVAAIATADANGLGDPEHVRDLAKASALGRVAGFPWYDGYVGARANDLVEKAGPDAGAESALALARGKVEGGAWNRALELLFGPADNAYAEPPFLEVAKLSPVQRQVIEAFSKRGPVPPSFVWFRPRGIPMSLEDRRIWLGLDPPLAMETVHVAGQPVWQWYTALRQQFDPRTEGDKPPDRPWDFDGFRAATQPLLEALPLADQLALSLENGRYGIWRVRVPQSIALHVGEPKKLAAQLAASDPSLARAVIGRRIDSFLDVPFAQHQRFIEFDVVEAWTATLRDGEQLPAELCRFIRLSEKYPSAVLRAAPPQALEAWLCSQYDERLGYALAGKQWAIGVRPQDEALVLPFIPSEAVARRILALGLLGGQWVGVLDATAAHDGVARTLAAFRALGEIKTFAQAKAAAKALLATQ